MKVPEIITMEWFNEVEAMTQEEVSKLVFTEEEKVRIGKFVNTLDSSIVWCKLIDLQFLTISFTIFRKPEFSFTCLYNDDFDFGYNLFVFMWQFAWFRLDILEQPKQELK